MVAIARPVGPNRYRESHGRYFEEFAIGDVYEHRPGRTITEADNINFSLLTMNFHPLHCDAAYAAKTEFGRCLVNSGLTIAIVLGMNIGHDQMYGPQAAWYSEMYASQVRYSGASLAYQLASIAGGIAPLVATKLMATSGVNAVAGYLIFTLTVSAVAAYYAPETRHREIA